MRRYELEFTATHAYSEYRDMVENEYGDWVKYEDAETELQKLREAFKRIELIKKLWGEHPAEVQMANDKFAHYTGGMKDSGDLNFRHCLFEASIRDLEVVLKTTRLRRMTKAMTSKEDALRHKATIAMGLLKQQRKSLENNK